MDSTKNSSKTWFQAVAKGDVSMVKLCLKNGVPVDLCDEDGDTALHIACKNGHLKVVEVLIENRALINAVNVEENTPLHEACLFGNAEIVIYLLENGASVFYQNKEGNTPLHLVVMNFDETYRIFNPHFVRRFDAKVIKLLLKKKALLEVRNFDGETPLQTLVCIDMSSSEKIFMMGLFLAEEADVNTQNNHGVSLLHSAVMNCEPAIIQFLLNNGAVVDVRDVYNRSPLDFAGEQRLWVLIIVLYKHVLKLKLAGIEVKEDIETIVLTSQQVTEMNQTSEICQLELEKMKRTTVQGSFSLYSLLLNSSNPRFLRDELLADSLEQLIQSFSLLQEYPKYGYILRNIFKMNKGSRVHLCYLASKSFMSDSRKMHWNYLPVVAQDNIFKYLSDKDLKNFSESV